MEKFPFDYKDTSLFNIILIQVFMVNKLSSFFTHSIALKAISVNFIKLLKFVN